MVENIFVNNFKILFPYLLTGSAFLVAAVCSAVFMMSNKIADLIWGRLPHCGVGWPPIVHPGCQWIICDITGRKIRYYRPVSIGLWTVRDLEGSRFGGPTRT